jgi:hypothetical protein
MFLRLSLEVPCTPIPIEDNQSKKHGPLPNRSNGCGKFCRHLMGHELDQRPTELDQPDKL